MRVYIGYDPAESIAYHVLSHSILRRASAPVSIAPVGNTVLPPAVWSRPRGKYDSTEFSNARFMVPWLAGYQGWVAFMDCDMLCLGDLVELFDQAEQQPDKALLVRQHNHQPTYSEKFLGQPQTQYPRKNWSSLMLLNCGHPVMRGLTPEYVNATPGIDLHGFKWCPDSFIGALPAGWNVLIEHGPRIPPDTRESEPRLVHYTQGGPWHGYLAQMFSNEWAQELEDLLAGDNPQATMATEYSPARATIEARVRYSLDAGRPGDRRKRVNG